MREIVEKHMNRLVALSRCADRETIAEHIIHFCEHVDGWLADEAHQRREVARQITELYQGNHDTETVHSNEKELTLVGNG